MNEDEDFRADQGRLAKAKAEAEAAADAEQIWQEVDAAASDPAVQAEWIRQSNLAYGGLVAAGLVMVQPFLTETSLDPSATVCVTAFAVSIPLLAALLILNRQEEFRRQMSRSWVVGLAKAVAQGSAFAGLAAGFWHMSMVAGIVFLAMGCLALAVHSSGYVQLEYDTGFRSRFRSRKPRS